MKCRFIHEVSARVVLRLNVTLAYGGSCEGNHHSMKKVVHEAASYQEACDWMKGKNLFEDASLWATNCERCGVGIDRNETSFESYGPERVYDTPSGRPEVGDMFFESCPGSAKECYHWDNCDGQHLHAICPDGTDWDIDSRANNCDMKADRQHRCWVRIGEPPDVTASKAGNTCGAGGGSILTPNYHGVLINGEFNPC